MYKCICTCLCSIVFAFGTQAQDKKTLRENNIKSITIYEKKTVKSGNETMESETTFDKHGNVVEEKEFNSEGKFKKHVKYVYDAEGNKIKETELDAGGKIVEMIESKYSNGLKISKVTKDAKGNILEEKRYVYKKFD